MPASDWSTFTVRIDVNASSSDLYHAWATRDGMEYWFLRSCVYKNPDGSELPRREPVKQGTTFRWMWHGYPDDTDEKGTILECNGRDLFRFSFGKAGDCTVKILTQSQKSIVELTQENIPNDDTGKMNYHVGCKTGWVFYLANMKSMFEGGTDLRNKDVSLKEMLNS